MDKKVKAKKLYDTLVEVFDSNNWPRHKMEEILTVISAIEVDGSELRYACTAVENAESVRLLFPLPFSVPNDKMIDIALAVCAINELLVNGSFDYNYKKGEIVFRMSVSFLYTPISDEVLEVLKIQLKNMIGASSQLVRDYNSQLFKLSEGEISIEKFLKELK